MQNFLVLLVVCFVPGIISDCAISHKIPERIEKYLPIGLYVRLIDDSAFFFNGEKIIRVQVEDTCSFRKWMISSGTISRQDLHSHDCSAE